MFIINNKITSKLLSHLSRMLRRKLHAIKRVRAIRASRYSSRKRLIVDWTVHNAKGFRSECETVE